AGHRLRQPRGGAPSGRSEARRLLRHDPEDRGDLLAHDDVQGLRDQRPPLPLAEPEHDLGELSDGSTLSPPRPARISAAAADTAPRRGAARSPPPSARSRWSSRSHSPGGAPGLAPPRARPPPGTALRSRTTPRGRLADRLST